MAVEEATANNKRVCLETVPPPTILSDVPASTSTMGRVVLIGTHDGNFHCDEALAIALLRLLPQYRDAVVVRTRDAAKLAHCQVVVDVGADYDPVRLRFDHHQRGFTHTLGEGYTTKLSSAGLVYKHFGKDVIAAVVQTVRGEQGTRAAGDQELLAKLYSKVYTDFIEHIDGIDNGVMVGEGELRYKVDVSRASKNRRHG